MDFTRALTFPFDDEEWLQKLGLGVLIQFIPIIGSFALQGWAFELAKRVRNNDPAPLPDWSDFGGKIGKGFMLWLGSLIYQLPTVLFACVMAFVMFLPAMGGDSEEAMAALGGLATIIAVCCSCVIVLYAIAASVVYAGGVVRYLDTEEFSTFLQFGDNLALVRENIGDFGMFLLYLIGAGLVAGVVSSITLGLASLLYGPFFAYFGGHLLGQLAIKVSGSMAAPAV